MLHHRHVTALRVGGVEIQIAAKDQAALVRLADIEMPHSKAHHMVDHRLQPLSDKGLQDVAFNRQAHPGHCSDLTRAACRHNRHLLGPDRPARGLHAADLTILDVDAGHFALLDQIDPALVRTPRVAPCHGIMPCGAAAPMQQPAVDGETPVVVIQIGQQLAQGFAVQKFRIVALVDHRIAAPGSGIALRVGVEQRDHSALAEHHIVIQFLRQAFPEL